MSDSIMASLGLASFDVTVQPHLCKSRNGKEVTLTEGELDTPLPRVCPECGGRMDRHDRHAVHVQGLPVLGRIHLLRVWVSRSRCRQCGHVESQKAGFVAQGHRITRRLEENGGLYRCYLLIDQLRGAFTSRDTRDPQLLRERFQAWLRLARHSGVP